MPKLNPNAQKWVDALRSGNYKQAKNFLRSGDRFCCLGVLCEVAKDNGLPVLQHENTYDGEQACLPETVRRWAGMRDNYGFLDGVEREDPDDVIKESLAVANDDGYSFEQIADLIEKYAEELGVAQ